MGSLSYYALNNLAFNRILYVKGYVLRKLRKWKIAREAEDYRTVEFF